MAKTTGGLVGQRRESLAERHAWKLFLGLSGLVAFIFGLGDMSSGGTTLQEGERAMMEGVSGTTWQALLASSPRVANLIDLFVRGGGANLLALGLLSGAVSLTALRRGERWAWYAMWVWPLWCALVVFFDWRVDKVPGAGTPVPVISGSIIFVITALALLLSYRKYFPNR